LLAAGLRGGFNRAVLLDKPGAKLNRIITLTVHRLFSQGVWLRLSIRKTPPSAAGKENENRHEFPYPAASHARLYQDRKSPAAPDRRKIRCLRNLPNFDNGQG
jgi:hypothetical protein